MVSSTLVSVFVFVAVFVVSDAKSFSEVRSCMEAAHRTCQKQCIGEIDSSKQAAAQECFSQSQMDAPKDNGMEQCLASKGITSCVKHGGPGGSHSHSHERGPPPSDGQDGQGQNGRGGPGGRRGPGGFGKRNETFRKFFDCEHQCMDSQKTDCESGCVEQDDTTKSAMRECFKQGDGPKGPHMKGGPMECLNNIA